MLQDLKQNDEVVTIGGIAKGFVARERLFRDIFAKNILSFYELILRLDTLGVDRLQLIAKESHWK